MKYKILLVPAMALAACGQAPHRAETAEQSAPATEASSVKTTSSATTPTDSAKIIRTADFSLQVTDVLQTATLIEKQARLSGGKVVTSKIDQQPSYYESYAVSADSVKQVAKHTAIGNLEVRVPSWQTDSFLNYVGSLPGFTQSRTLAETDVTIDYLENQLRAQQREKLTAAAPTPNKTTSLDDLVEVGDQAISSQVNNMRLRAQTAYTTISFELRGQEQISVQTVPNWDAISRPSFGTRVKMAGIYSFRAFEQVLIGLLYILPYALIALLGVWVFRKRHALGWPRK